MNGGVNAAVFAFSHQDTAARFNRGLHHQSAKFAYKSIAVICLDDLGQSPGGVLNDYMHHRISAASFYPLCSLARRNTRSMLSSNSWV
jgi:hypothetical protein